MEARKAVAMHWGTFILSQESVDAPKKDLKMNLEKFGIDFEDFFVLKHGETINLNRLHTRKSN